LLVLGVVLLIRRRPIAWLALFLFPLPWLSASPSLSNQAEPDGAGFRVAVANLSMA
jgi:hypothetical protein